MSMEKHQLTKDRQSLADQLPALAKRIFNLSSQFYEGCGFNWCNLTSIGYLLWQVNNYDKKYDKTTQITMEVIYEDLLWKVEKAEIDAQQYNKLLDT